MLAVGLGEEEIEQFLEPFDGRIGVACVNSANSVTISGDVDALELLEQKLRSSKSASRGDSVFFRRLQVPLAYHSHHMELLGYLYHARLRTVTSKLGSYPMYSSVTGKLLDGRGLGADYWRQNLESTVLFSDAVKSMVVGGASVNTFLEIGPHSALASLLREIQEEIGLPAEALLYFPTLTRRKDASHAVLEAAGKLFTHGYTSLDLEKVNGIEENVDEAIGKVIYRPRRVLVDLPSYAWDHSQEYWLECRRSREWRLRGHPRHDILGARVPGIHLSEPQWMNILSISNAPWIQDHAIRGNVVFPAAGYICMAVEALTQYLESNDQFNSDDAFLLREITIQKPLILGDARSRSQNAESPLKGSEVFLTLRAEQNNTADASRWYRFNIYTTSRTGKGNLKHCSGTITMEKKPDSYRPPATRGQDLQEIHHRRFYEALNAVGFNYGPTFARLRNLEARLERQEMWAEMSNSMDIKDTCSTGKAKTTKEEAFVGEDRVKREYSEDEFTMINTPTTSSGAGTSSPKSEKSVVLILKPKLKLAVDPLLVPPQLDPAVTQFEGLGSTESAAVATLRRRMGQDADEHIESRYVIHPVNLDLTLQLLFGALHSGRMSTITDIMVPVSIEEVYIAMPSPETEAFTMHAIVEDMGDIHSVAYDGSGQEVIRVKNVQARELGQAATGPGAKRDPNIMRLKWVVDYDSLTQDNFAKAMNTVVKPRESAHRLEDDLQLNYLIGLMTAQMIEMTEDLTPAKPHFEKYRSWLIGYHEWNCQHQSHDSDLNSDPAARKMEIERLTPHSGVRGELVYSIYANTLSLFRGEIEITEIVEKDDLWTRFNAAEDITQSVRSLSDLYSAKYSKANILEIGAGTGCGTHAILEGCTTNAGTPSMERRYQSYTFTDINAELVADGRDRFGLGYKGMDFRTLDIERDPELQGFERRYDIVYAINVGSIECSGGIWNVYTNI